MTQFIKRIVEALEAKFTVTDEMDIRLEAYSIKDEEYELTMKARI